VSLEFSPDGKRLYATSELARAANGWPPECRPEGGQPPGRLNPEGALLAIDVARAITDPEHSILSEAPAGCGPVRLALSPSGDRVYVSARDGGELLVFDSARLIADPARARSGSVPLGAPIGLAVLDSGTRIAVANLRSLDPSEAHRDQQIAVIDPAKAALGRGAVIGAIPAGEYPRELAVSNDGRTLFLTNFFSNTVQIVDWSRFRR
jgi:DNA-binding beta-propeller fold protein YncE